MRLLILFIMAGGIGAAVVLFKRHRRNTRRRLALQAPFPVEWNEILNANLPPYTKFSDDLRHQLQDKMKIFLAEKSFEGCDGLTVTDEMRVTIAAQACLLLLNRPSKNYPKLSSILIYPSAYMVKDGGRAPHNAKTTSVRLGESWSHGTVVLAWDSVKHGARNFKDSRNVTMHEFAHQLDQADGRADGAPILEERSAYSSWAAVFSKEFEKLQKGKRKRRSVLNRYGATNPAEFFAVATESFFEKPKQMRKKHPELYEELHDYYKVDPMEWT
ncbi:MAG: zinc-dependent peptidase [Desulfobacteraceae bacterium]|nr:zinc-dependent peptidase [Desulfobacteraceae bacterium]